MAIKLRNKAKYNKEEIKPVDDWSVQDLAWQTRFLINNMKNILILLMMLIVLAACEKSETAGPAPVTTTYFPPLSGTEWQTTSPASLGWSATGLNDLYTYLQSKNSKAFIILKDGRIVVEKYFGSFTADSNWYWASAGKTMTAMLAGIAKQEGLLDINKKTSDYLGTGWTSAPLAKENLITIRHQLTMTTGLDDGVPDNDCTLPSCLSYKADAGTRWAYHNAPYTLLDKVIESATGKSFNSYFQEKIRDKTGMNGTWFKGTGFNNVYYSNARSMARFGLLMLNKGKWDQTNILSDASYFSEQTNTSQNLNLSYGYLTWLNGKSSYML
ncbi:MAG TPA: serine hydrolase domain-containing protein, partial [Chitinophagaceae bacterium]|nr:serine hydrolase domain-containing protein [Chitinophagaceae bacterium]